MPSREYHEERWRTLAHGLEPADFDLRLSYLLSQVRSGERVLDVGCAEGRFAVELARAGAEVVGVDIAEEPLRRARALHPELDLRLLEGEGSWPLEEASFDVLWAGEVLEHVSDTAAWLSEARRVLRSGGRLLLSTPDHSRLRLLGLALSKSAFAARFDPLGEHLRFYSAATLRELLEGFRFEALDVRAAAGPPGARRLLLARAVRSRF